MKYFFPLALIACFLYPRKVDRLLDSASSMPIDNGLLYPDLVSKFYTLNGNKLFWSDTLLRQELRIGIDSAYYLGLAQSKYHWIGLKQDNINPDSASLWNTDRLYTDAAIALCKDLHQGYMMNPWVGYDQLSEKYGQQKDEFLLRSILKVSTAHSLRSLTASLEPAHKEYGILKDALRKHLEKSHMDTVQILRLSMNYYRWIHHFGFDKVIIVNLPEARLQYLAKDSMQLNMKIVVGKTSTPTPRFATICDQVILYPYWYVPRSITFNEYLPRIKKNPSWIDANNMQVIDGSGKIMDHQSMNWNLYHSGYFPYTIRQSTGCDNALGVIKFNIVTPYGVYLHDTNNKTAFLSGLRYYSHGCIRIEQPLELGNKLLDNRLDTTYLQSCFRNQKPEFIKLDKPVPVFSVYNRAVVDPQGKIRYFKDVYKLMK